MLTLWIAFKIVSLYTIRNVEATECEGLYVVNCFQNCIFIYYSQQRQAKHHKTTSCELLSKLYLYILFATMIVLFIIKISCELLSKLYLYILFATGTSISSSATTLWIAFKIVSLYTIRNRFVKLDFMPIVVNCFQNCIFIYYSQLDLGIVSEPNCCELLSKLYLYILFATAQLVKRVIARCELLSKLYLYILFATLPKLIHLPM